MMEISAIGKEVTLVDIGLRAVSASGHVPQLQPKDYLIESLHSDVFELKTDDLGVGFDYPTEEGSLTYAKVALDETFDGSIHVGRSYHLF